MVADAAAYGQAERAGNGRNGTTSKPHTEDPATTEAVSSKASPPVEDFSSAFQPACRKPAPSTASVTPSVSSKRYLGTLRRMRLALLPAVLGCARIDHWHRFGLGCRFGRFFETRLGQHSRLLQDRVGDRANVRVDTF